MCVRSINSNEYVCICVFFFVGNATLSFQLKWDGLTFWYSALVRRTRSRIRVIQSKQRTPAKTKQLSAKSSIFFVFLVFFSYIFLIKKKSNSNKNHKFILWWRLDDFALAAHIYSVKEKKKKKRQLNYFTFGTCRCIHELQTF